MKKMSVWPWLIFIMVISFAVLLACGLMLAVWQKGPGSAEAASWMQAIGSIGAIMGSFAVANHQYKLAARAERDREQKAEEKALLNILVIASQANILIQDALTFRMTEHREELADTVEYRQREVRKLKDIHSTLAEIRLHELGNVNVINSLIELRHIVADCSREIEILNDKIWCGPTRFVDEFEACAARAKEEINNIESAVAETSFLNCL